MFLEVSIDKYPGLSLDGRKVEEVGLLLWEGEQ